MRSRWSMPIKCSFGPFSMPNDNMNVRLPMVKESANLCGCTLSMGTPTKKARAKNSADKNKRPQNTYENENEVCVC